eukprot:TRINITY_DN2391_c0_g1_i2.p1 TRINITY_DN2391_c0_g1~~TRINITY_DN2391_c0_g1_i2.p1  ORF type:complete len:187 (-),score=24.78 TRINITY_DN2391_c0_g1_i2:21-581(-)
MAVSARWIHSTTSLFLGFPLFVTALTGFMYRWGRNVFGIEKEGSYFSFPGTVLWTGMNGIGLMLLIVTGYQMMRGFWKENFQWRPPQSFRELHQKLSSFVILFLTLTGVTGWAYRWGRNVFGLEKESLKWLLMVHQGSYLDGMEVLYTGMIGAAFITMILSGVTLSALYRRFMRSLETDRSVSQVN